MLRPCSAVASARHLGPKEPPMIRPLHFLHLLILLALSIGPASAQVTTGTPPFGSFGGGPDVINLANLNSHIAIPVLHKPGRGTNFTYDLSYDTYVWFRVTSNGTTSWQPVQNWGWRAVTEVVTGYVNYSSTIGSCYDPDLRRRYNYTVYNFQYYHDSLGVSHPLNVTVSTQVPCSFGPPYNSSATVTDGSGLSVTVTAAPSATVTSPHGTVFPPPLQQGTGAGSFTDRNGNQSTADASGHFYDTLSSTTPVLT